MLKIIRGFKNLIFHDHDKLLFLVSLLVFILFARQISDAAYSRAWDEARHYASLFNWASIQTAFLFGIYTFIIGRPGRFRDRFEGTKLYVDAMKYLRETVFRSFIFSFLCLPFMFVAPNVPKWSGWKEIDMGYIFFAFSCVVALYLFGRILISMKIFMFVETEMDKSK